MFARITYMQMIHLPLLMLVCGLLSAEEIGQGVELANFLSMKPCDFSMVASKTKPSDLAAACLLYPGNGLEADRILVVRKTANGKPLQSSLAIYGTVDLLDCIVDGSSVAMLTTVRIGRNGDQEQLRLITFNGDQKTEKNVSVKGSNFSGRLFSGKSVSGVVALDNVLAPLTSATDTLLLIENRKQDTQLFCTRTENGCGVWTCTRNGRIQWLEVETQRHLEIILSDKPNILGVISKDGVNVECLLADIGNGLIVAIEPNADKSALEIFGFLGKEPAEVGAFLGGILVSNQQLIIAYLPFVQREGNKRAVQFATLNRDEESRDVTRVNNRKTYQRNSSLGTVKFGRFGDALIYSRNGHQVMIRD